MDQRKLQQIKTFFNAQNGFGDYKHIAINLLRDTINVLNDMNINFFIISGTLLGHVRHNDFIPWDDDIDLIVDESILDKLSDIVARYGKQMNFITRDQYIVKTCYDNGQKMEHEWSKYLLNGINYTWPFVDLFIYRQSDDQIIFFNKSWDSDKFFPATQVLFNNITVNIPNIPDYFLAKNYGTDYMTTIMSSNYNHKSESRAESIALLPMRMYEIAKNNIDGL